MIWPIEKHFRPSMVNHLDLDINDKWILSKRGNKNEVSPFIPYAFHVEDEFTHNGKIEQVTTIFLSNKECPFHCLMCDLWKNTTEEKVPGGAISQQIKYALDRLPETRHLKLYNSGNFFDAKAIPREDYHEIAEMVSPFDTLIVECHPKLINQKSLDFSQSIKPTLQIAMGLETVHPELLPILNKQMTLEDFEKAAAVLKKSQILTRTFILLGLPFITEEEAVCWAKRSIDFAFDVGVECCVVIPTRTGNGAMNYFQEKEMFHEPGVHSLLEVIDYGIKLGAGRVFADLWDLDHFSRGESDFDGVKKKLEEMNLRQIPG